MTVELVWLYPLYPCHLLFLDFLELFECLLELFDTFTGFFQLTTNQILELGFQRYFLVVVFKPNLVYL